ncbi:MAG: class I SAM-dependent methyltransferase [bacterium]|nr:class I SAM-dependent methyltransferase [bacterium]
MDIYKFPHMYECAFRTIPPLCIWRKEWEKEVHRFLTSIPSPPLSVIDVCCGTGFLSTLIKRAYPNTKIVGIDKSKSMIEFASTYYSSTEFRCEDISSLTDSFDVLIMGGGLITISIEDVIDVIERITPSHFILSGYKNSIWSFPHKIFTRVITGKKYYTYHPDKIRNIFALKGFDVKTRMIDVIEGSYVIYKIS